MTLAKMYQRLKGGARRYRTTETRIKQATVPNKRYPDQRRNGRGRVKGYPQSTP